MSAEWHLIDDTADQLKYWPSKAWQAATGEDTEVYNEGTYHRGQVLDEGASISYVWLQFRGTGIRIRTGPGGNGTCVLQRLRGDSNYFPSEDEFPCAPDGDTSAQVFEQTGLDDEDHEIEIRIYRGDGEIVFDAIEIQSSHGQGLDLELLGPDASNVPSDATTYDDSSQIIQYSAGWSPASGNVRDYNGTSTASQDLGEWFAIEFEGTGIWWYGQGPLAAEFAIRLDDGPPETLNLIGMSIALQSQTLTWNATDLEPTRHTLNVTKTDSGIAAVDFIRILEVGGGASTFLPTPTTEGSSSRTSDSVSSNSSTQSAPIDDGNSISSSSRKLSGGAIGGIVVGILLLLAAVVIAVLLYKIRKKRKSQAPLVPAAPTQHILAHSSQPTPYIIPFGDHEKAPLSASTTTASSNPLGAPYTPYTTSPSQNQSPNRWAPPSHPPETRSDAPQTAPRRLPPPPSEGGYYEDGRMHE